MHVSPSLSLAARAIVRRPLRSFLLAQGTAWGVAAAILPAAVLDGTRAAARERAEALGVDRLVLVRDPTAAGDPLTVRDLAVVRETLGPELRDAGAVRLLVPGDEREGTLFDAEGDDPASSPPPKAPTWIATTPEGGAARGLSLARGRWLREGDPHTVCVVEAGVASRLGRVGLDVGDRIDGPNGLRHEVVGVTAPRDALALATDDAGFDTRHPLYRGVALPLLAVLGVPPSVRRWPHRDESIHVPFAAARDDVVDEIVVRLRDPAAIRGAGHRLRQHEAFADRPVLARHALVLPSLLDERLDRFRGVALAMFLACLGMGAVAIANLGLVTAIARRGEIALHRVEGATRGDVARQVLAEGVLLGAFGAALGCGLGCALAALRVRWEPASGFAWTFPSLRAALACGVALLVGGVAAWLPARRVARSDPASALDVE